jgi:hypothetical protein
MNPIFYAMIKNKRLPLLKQLLNELFPKETALTLDALYRTKNETESAL